MILQFPPLLAVGLRVWSSDGYSDHGPATGPKVKIKRRMGGAVTNIESAFGFGETKLYCVTWDDGTESKHYGNDLFCIDHFSTRKEFEEAIRITAPVTLWVGPRGGFRSADISIEYNGDSGNVTIHHRDFWTHFLEKIAKRQKVRVTRQKDDERPPMLSR